MPPATTGPFDTLFHRCGIALVEVRRRHIVWANDAMHRIFGYEPDELVGKPTRQMFPDQCSYEAFGRELDHALKAGGHHSCIACQTRKDGSAGWFEFHIAKDEADPDRIVGAVIDRSESRDLAQQLRSSDERYRTVVEDQTEIISRFRPDGTFIFVNDVYCRLFGKAAEELIGGKWHPVAHPDDLPLIEAKLREMTLENPVVVIENRVFVASGDLRWIQFVNRGFFADDGQLREIQSVGRDITRLKQVVATLRESQATLQRAQAVAHIGSFALGSDVDHFAITPETGRLFGLADRREVTYAEWFTRVHPDDQGFVADAWRPGLHGAPYDVIYRIVVDGRLRWIHAVAEFEFDVSGALLKAVGTVQDITDRKVVDERLAASRTLLELALWGADLGTWDTDLLSRRSTFDERFCAMLGRPPGELEPSMDAWLALVHPADLPGVLEAIRTHLAGESVNFEVEYRLRHKAGHWVWVLARGRATYDAQGRPVRVSGTHLDISDRKRVAVEGMELLRKIQRLIADLDAPSGPVPARPEVRARTRLSARNREMLQLIAEGRTTVQIARELRIAESTAKTHRRNLMRKLGLSTKADLIRYAIRHGIVQN